MVRTLAMSAGVLALSAAAPADEPKPFAELVDRYISEYALHDPIAATSLGIHTEDARLTSYSAASNADDRRWAALWRARFAAVSAQTSDRDERIDATMLVDAIDLNTLQTDTLHALERDPNLYATAFGDAIHYLLIGSAPSAQTRFDAVAARLRDIPSAVREAEQNLRTATPEAVRQALSSNAGTIELYRSLPREAHDASPQTRARIGARLPAALSALHGFSQFLRFTLLPRATLNPRIGAAAYDRDLQLENGTAMKSGDLIAAAQSDITRLRQRMYRMTIANARRWDLDFSENELRRIDPDLLVKEALAELSWTHVHEHSIARATQSVTRAQRFIARRALVPLPPTSRLSIAYVPRYLRDGSSILDNAAAFSRAARYWFYTNHGSTTDFGEQIEALHEAMPGHYVQLRSANEHSTPARRLTQNSAFVEGWAMYVESMIPEAGFNVGPPGALEFFALNTQLQIDVSAIADAAFHTRGLTREQLRRLEHRAYTDDDNDDWNRLHYEHNQASSYFVGWNAIRLARDHERARGGPTFSLADFHARLLAMGAVEPRFIAELLDADRAR